MVVLHKLRNEMTPRSREPVYTVSLTDLERKVPSDAQSFYKHGVELYREGKTDEALAAYGQAIRSYPNYVEALSDVATIYLLMNRPDAALTMLKRAQQIDGHNSVVRINIAIAHMNRGDYRESVKTLQNLIVEDYQDSVALYYLAKAYLLDKKFKEAHTAIQAAITNDPQMIDAWVLQLNLALEQDNHPLACETLHELRRRLDNNAFSEFAEQQTVMLND